MYLLELDFYSLDFFTPNETETEFYLKKKIKTDDDIKDAGKEFLNKGVKTDPILVEKITDNDGNTLAKFTAKQERVLTEEIAWLMLYMFRGGMEEPGGTSQALWEWDL